LSLSALDTILISGLGSVGLGAVVNASVRGARILAIESHPYRTQLGLALGVEKVISPLAPDALEQIKKLTFLRGVDKSVETSSTPSALAFLGLATKKKGAVACVGWAGEMPASTLVGRGLRVFGAWHWNHLRDGEAMWRTIRKSKIKLDQLITHRFPMSRVEEAWEVQSTGACGKIMMDPWN
jgi:threonine 3-dehydrogenase